MIDSIMHVIISLQFYIFIFARKKNLVVLCLFKVFYMQIAQKNVYLNNKKIKNKVQSTDHGFFKDM